MKATEGLYPYERLLAACGLVLFASLIWIIILRVKRRESIKVELLGFVVPIVMIGFPAIKKIQYEDGKLTIDKQVRLLERNPENHEARAELEETLANVEKRAGLDDQGHADIDDFDPDTVLYVADGKKALGDYAFAFEQAGFVLEADPEIEKAAQIRNEAADLLITDQLANPTHLVISDPQALELLEEAANVVKTRGSLSPKLDEALIATLKGLGNETEAAERLNNLEQSHPNFRIDPKLKEALRDSGKGETNGRQ